MPLPTTLGSLGIFLISVAPGLLFEVGLARRLNYMRRSLADRLLRFVAWSLMFNVLLLPGTVAVANVVPSDLARVSVGGVVAMWLWGLCLTVVPYALGVIASARDGLLRRLLLDRDPAPTSWHLLWGEMRTSGDVVYLRARLREGQTWVAGVWSYSSDEPEDILLSPRLACDEVTGRLVNDRAGRPVPVDWAVLVRHADVDLVEVQS